MKQEMDINQFKSSVKSSYSLYELLTLLDVVKLSLMLSYDHIIMIKP